MKVLVVGSIALDSVKTPYGEEKDTLGGAATYFSVAASYFAPVQLVGVIGTDFPEKHVKMLASKKIDLKGLIREEGRTFRWSGSYEGGMAQAKTLDTQLNVFERFCPDLPESYKGSRFVFLANIDPDIQYYVLKQLDNPFFVGCDTMNFWISGKNKELRRILKKVNALFINEDEARQFSGESSLLKAVKCIQKAGPGTVIIKRGEYGSMMVSGDRITMIPAFPLAAFKDPTGAGDTFGGGFMGRLAMTGRAGWKELKSSLIYGTVMASFNVEQFSIKGIQKLDRRKIDARVRDFIRILEI